MPGFVQQGRAEAVRIRSEFDVGKPRVFLDAVGGLQAESGIGVVAPRHERDVVGARVRAAGRGRSSGVQCERPARGLVLQPREVAFALGIVG